MKLRDGVIVNEVDGAVLAVDATSDSDKRFNGILKMNRTAGFVAGLLEHETELDKIVETMMIKYDVSEEDARRNAQKVIEAFQKAGLLV